MRFLFLILMICSCCSTKPTMITNTECNQKAIDNYIKECIPNKVQGKEWQYYFDECNKQAKQKFCNEKRYLIIKGTYVICDSIPEKYREYCR